MQGIAWGVAAVASPRLQSTRTLLPVSLAGAGPRGPGNSYRHDACSFCYAGDISAALTMIGTPFDAKGNRVLVLDSLGVRPASILRFKSRTGDSDEA